MRIKYPKRGLRLTSKPIKFIIMLQPIKKETLDYDNDSIKYLYTYENVSKKELELQAERLTYREHCGCPHDCCGCFVQQWAEVKSDNTIEVVECYNY